MDVYDSKIQRRLAPKDGSFDSLAEKVTELRGLFRKEFEDNRELYDQRDFDRLMDPQDDWHTRRWVIYQREMTIAFEMLKDTMRWRKEMDLNGLSYEDFPREFFECGCAFEYGQDKQGKCSCCNNLANLLLSLLNCNQQLILIRTEFRPARPRPRVPKPIFVPAGRRVLYIRCRLFKPMNELNELYDKFFAFIIDQCDKRSKSKGFSMIYDVTDAGLSNVEMVSSPKKSLWSWQLITLNNLPAVL